MRKLWFVVVALLLCLPLIAPAEEAVPGGGLFAPQEDPAATAAAPAAGATEGRGTHFEVSRSGYLDIVLDSAEPIELQLTSSPELVTMHLAASPDNASTLITLGGFVPLTTYYKYEDDYHNKEMFTSDEAGRFTFVQDLTAAHFVYIQPRKSTKFISDSATGGDCASIGVWDAATKTCTLLVDLSESVQIDSNNITLDGNGHTITGTGTGFGVYVPSRTGVTIKGLTVRNFGDGIYLLSSASCTVSGNTTLSNTAGAYYGGGIHLDNTSYSTVIGNTSSNNSNAGIAISGSTGDIVTGNTVTGNLAGIRTGYIYANRFSGNIAENNGAGFAIVGSNKPWEVLNNVFENNIARNNGTGIGLNANYNTLRANTVSGNDIGISFNIAEYNTLTDNIVKENLTHDIMFRWFYLSGGYGMMVGSLDCNNTIENTTGAGDRPLKYFNHAVELRDEVLSGLILCDADGSTISNVTIEGSDTLNNNGLIMIRTDNATLTNVVSSHNKTGIYLNASTNNVIENAIVNNNEDGIRLSWDSSGNVIRNNSARDNSRTGMYMHHGSKNDNIVLAENAVSNSPYGIVFESGMNGSITGNTVTNTSFGIYFYGVRNSTMTDNRILTSSYPLYLSYTDGMQIYNNSFIEYGYPASLTASTGNVFNLDRPVGGNYWSKFDTPSEGCSDADKDGFCDAPYNVGGAFDNLPWATQDAWKTPVDTVAPTTAIMISGVAGDDGWYRSAVAIALTATDNDGGSGVKEVHYVLGGTETVAPGDSASLSLTTEGTGELRYFAKDNAGNAETPHELTVRIDTTAPVITATVTPAPNAQGWNDSDVTVTFACSDTISGIALCPAPVTVTAEGPAQVVSGTARDKAGNTATASVTVNLDRTAPTVDLSVNPGTLWPPDHRMVTVLPSLSVRDALDASPRVQLVSVTSNEPDNGLGDGDTEADIAVNADGTISLRAERSGSGSGRVYTITYQVTDAAGNATTASATVTVPHSM